MLEDILDGEEGGEVDVAGRVDVDDRLRAEGVPDYDRVAAVPEERSVELRLRHVLAGQVGRDCGVPERLELAHDVGEAPPAVPGSVQGRIGPPGRVSQPRALTEAPSACRIGRRAHINARTTEPADAAVFPPSSPSLRADTRHEHGNAGSRQRERGAGRERGCESVAEGFGRPVASEASERGDNDRDPEGAAELAQGAVAPGALPICCGPTELRTALCVAGRTMATPAPEMISGATIRQ